jgi:hypothetical protein
VHRTDAFGPSRLEVAALPMRARLVGFLNGRVFLVFLSKTVDADPMSRIRVSWPAVTLAGVEPPSEKMSSATAAAGKRGPSRRRSEPTGECAIGVTLVLTKEIPSCQYTSGEVLPHMVSTFKNGFASGARTHIDTRLREGPVIHAGDDVVAKLHQKVPVRNRQLMWVAN